ncbi:hypothetical protein FB451DRAFT_1522918 [Mycena latifolia]|nr:hypothetical protein FB451DRAFT_1522918 [Mycena latifolia]
MRLTTLIPALCIFAPRVFALDAAFAAARQTALSFTSENCYNAPIPPWKPDCRPGWYFGRPQNTPLGLTCLLLCTVLELLFGDCICPSVPPPIPPTPPPVGPTPPPMPTAPSGYTFAFTNLTKAVQVSSGYCTFGIVETMQGCADMCTKVPECKCANSYYDVNAGAGKGNTKMLTCSLFDVEVTAADAINAGGQQQQQPPAGLTQITNSYAFCKT